MAHGRRRGTYCLAHPVADHSGTTFRRIAPAGDRCSVEGRLTRTHDDSNLVDGRYSGGGATRYSRRVSEPDVPTRNVPGGDRRRRGISSIARDAGSIQPFSFPRTVRCGTSCPRRAKRMDSQIPRRSSRKRLDRRTGVVPNRKEPVATRCLRSAESPDGVDEH